MAIFICVVFSDTEKRNKENLTYLVLMSILPLLWSQVPCEHILKVMTSFGPRYLKHTTHIETGCATSPVTA